MCTVVGTSIFTLKFTIDQITRFFAAFNKGILLLQQYRCISVGFGVKLKNLKPSIFVVVIFMNKDWCQLELLKTFDHFAESHDCWIKLILYVLKVVGR